MQVTKITFISFQLKMSCSNPITTEIFLKQFSVNFVRSVVKSFDNPTKKQKSKNGIIAP